MAKPRVTMQPTRAKEVSTQSVQMLNPDAWREGLTTAQRGYGGKWQRYRLKFLERNALCVMCQAKGKVTEATVVDHIVDHRGNQALFWAPDNHQGLCKPCHGIKTAADGGIGQARKG
jgi:5-methylcytosine-specific restriction endonuclease McrA